MPNSIAIIGAGLSAATLNYYLQSKAEITVFEKARGAGGRLSRHQYQDFYFDTGAQDFIQSTNHTSDFIENAMSKKILAPWQPRFRINNGSTKTDTDIKHQPIFCAQGSMSALIKPYLLSAQTHFNTRIKQLVNKDNQYFLITNDTQQYGPFNKVVFTCPAPQVMALTKQFDDALKAIEYSSCLIVHVGLGKALPQQSPDVTKSENTTLRWLIQPARKPGNISQPALTLQSKALPFENLQDNKDSLSQKMIEEACTLLDCPLDIVYQKQHLWRYSKCLSPIKQPYLADKNLFVIGDCLQPKPELSLLESCIESAKQLVHMMLTKP